MVVENYQAKISPKNKEFIKKIKNHADSNSIIGIIDVESLPAPQFQKIRASLKGKAEVLIVKKNLIKLALEDLEAKYAGLTKLLESMSGIVGLIFTNDNPFSLYKLIQKNKSSAPAKGGSIAPKDIIVQAGPTSFAPGPIIGELGSFKIKAGINAGKVEIKEDTLVVKEGEEISAKLAEILTRLGIEPMEVGLNIKAVYEDETIYTRSVLDVDEEAILNDIKNQASRSFALSLGLGYPTKDNIKTMIGMASKDSLGLGLGLDYPATLTIKQLFAKANNQLVGVANNLPEDIRPAGIVTKTVSVAQDSNDQKSANEEPKEEKKEESKADAAAGLGSLF